ncbi:MAG: GNAT family N-acetyltransferase [Methylocystis sp.]|uniref:GNAT family N-acetyltransferase n=1 Tax=Methylocystis sp. TaxID=1911079 RepID=UPI003DA4C75D
MMTRAECVHGTAGYPSRSNRRGYVRIGRGFDDLAMVYALRAAVYLAEQDCPYREEFDGNDACSTHFIGFVGDEPAGVLRARYFADFVKLERLAVLKRFRRSTIAFDLVREGISFARRKGFQRIYGHSREGLEPFWARFGARPFDDGRTIEFSDCRYTEMVIELTPDPDAITLNSGGQVIIRPEGDWDRPGVLEQSETRGSTYRAGNAVKTRAP